MKPEIDTEYAPDGYRAELASMGGNGRACCAGCAFEDDGITCDSESRPCSPFDRSDGTHVIFVKL